ncbi:MAG: ABC transporter permease, partial [Cyclobacteriaceae bacterium]|nr:ABC transporter permease [Cyclobacteriaceae bacterium]
MKSILLISIANIKRRKLQSFLIGSCIALSTLLFSTTLGIMNGIREPFDIMFDQLKASHILLYFDHHQQDTERITQWFSEQFEVESVAQSVPYFTLDEPIIFKGEEIDLNVQLTEHHDGNLEQDKVLILKGEEKKHPAMGEIWIPNHLATANNIQIGDTVGIPVSEGLYPLIVSATLVDPHYASGLFNPTRAWIAPGSLPFILPISKLNRLMLGVRLESPDDIDALWSKFNEAFIYNGKSLQYNLFKSVFLSFYNIISMVLMVFSVLAILAALFILFTTLSGAIASDYQLIGIYKAQGFTPGNVITSYLIQYLLLTMLSLPFGILGSYFATNAVMSSLIKSIGLVNLNFSFFYPFTITIGMFLGLVALLTYLGSRVAGK